MQVLGRASGLDYHQALDNLLKENMVIAIEPGIYVPKSFGIRIEDTVLVTKNGCIKLTKSEKNYTIIA